MYAVQCPASMLWHPAVHHSLLLLRALRQKHTLQLIEPYSSNNRSTVASRLALPLLAEGSAALRIVYTLPPPASASHEHNTSAAHIAARATSTENSCSGGGDDGAVREVFCVRQPEHLLMHYLSAFSSSSSSSHTNAPTLSDAMRAKLQADLGNYLDTCVICQQLCSATDALLVALCTPDMELIRRCHAALMDMLERLERSIEPDGLTTTTAHTAASRTMRERDERSTSEAADTAHETTHHTPHTLSTTSSTSRTSPVAPGGDEQPLCSWPLYATLAFFLEHAGLLRSAFPQLTQAYTALRRTEKGSSRDDKKCSSSSSIAVAQHERLIQRTLAAYQGAATAAAASSPHDDRTHTAAASLAVGRDQPGSSSNRSDDGGVVRYPQANFLHDVQRRLAAYTSAAEERLVEGVTGDGGPLRWRTSGGRFGVQTVAARLPWTMRQGKLPHN